MRKSRVLSKLRNGDVSFCFKLNLADARAAEIAAASGFDCLWTDMEHVPNDFSTVERQIWAAKSHDVDTLVRVSRGGYSDYVRPLEMDASGIMIPHIMSLRDAENVVHMTRFHPIGRRPLDGGNADGAYCGIDLNAYMKQANEERFVVVQIEDPEPLSDLEKIAALPGIDMLFFGPGDFSQGIGFPGEWDNPLIAETRSRIAAVCAAHGKFAGTVGGTGNVQDLISMGYRFISVGADVAGLGEYCRGIISEIGKIDCVPGKNNIYGGR